MINPIFKLLLCVGMVCLWGCKDYDLVIPQYLAFQDSQVFAGNSTVYSEAIQTKDYNYLIVGYTLDGNGTKNILLVKYPRVPLVNGIQSQIKHYLPALSNTSATCVKETTAGYLMVGGQEESWGYLLKVDSLLDNQYSGFIDNTLLNYQRSKIEDLDIAPDGRIITLVSATNSSGNRGLYIIPFIDTRSALEGQTPIPVTISNFSAFEPSSGKMSIDVSNNGLIAIAGTYDSIGWKVGFLAQLDQSGISRKPPIAYRYHDYKTVLHDVVVSDEGDCYAVGYKSDDITSDVFFVKSGGTGSWKDTMTYQLSNVLMEATGITLTKDGNIAIVGQKNVNGIANIMFLKVNTSTGEKWPERLYGNGNNNTGKSIFQTTDGGFLITGVSDDGVLSKGYLVKTDPEGK